MKDDRRREAEEMTAELKGYVREGRHLRVFCGKTAVICGITCAMSRTG